MPCIYGELHRTDEPCGGGVVRALANAAHGNEAYSTPHYGHGINLHYRAQESFERIVAFPKNYRY